MSEVCVGDFRACHLAGDVIGVLLNRVEHCISSVETNVCEHGLCEGLVIMAPRRRCHRRALQPRGALHQLLEERHRPGRRVRGCAPGGAALPQRRHAHARRGGAPPCCNLTVRFRLCVLTPIPKNPALRHQPGHRICGCALGRAAIPLRRHAHARRGGAPPCCHLKNGRCMRMARYASCWRLDRACGSVAHAKIMLDAVQLTDMRGRIAMQLCFYAEREHDQARCCTLSMPKLPQQRDTEPLQCD